MCVTLKNVIEDIDETESIPVPKVSGAILAKVIDFCEHHADDQERAVDLSDWNLRFLDMDKKDMFEVVLAANFLNSTPLIEVVCRYIAKSIRGKNSEEIREMFNIKNDFTKQEEEAAEKQTDWAFCRRSA